LDAVVDDVLVAAQVVNIVPRDQEATSGRGLEQF
jgi:hypothetical protein